jgi:hypothetical protein
MNSKADILIVDDEANTLASLSRWSWRSRALSI